MQRISLGSPHGAPCQSFIHIISLSFIIIIIIRIHVECHLQRVAPDTVFQQLLLNSISWKMYALAGDEDSISNVGGAVVSDRLSRMMPSCAASPGSAVSIVASGRASTADNFVCQQVATTSCGATFSCPKCRKTLPLTESTPKGTQLWCVKDNRAYNSLTQRWARAPKLRAWWASLTPDQQCEWFLKWQNMTPKARFAAIQYYERWEQSVEDLFDEVDGWIPWREFLRDGLTEGTNRDTLNDEWMNIIETQRSECKLYRNQWLIPQCNGLRRIKRKRVADIVGSERRAEIGDPQQMQSLIASGQARLQQVQDAIMPVMTAPVETGPQIHSRPADQPQRAETPTLLLDAIVREVCLEKFLSRAGVGLIPLSILILIY